MRKQSIWEKLLGILAALCIWQVLAMAVGHQVLLASPLSVIRRLATIWREPDFFGVIAFSLQRIALGFGIGLVLGVGFAVLSARFSVAEMLLRPYVTAMKTVPVASIIVISLIWFGARSLSVFISFMMVFPILYTDVLSGIRSADPKLAEMARIFRIGPWKRLRFLYVPQVTPYLLSGCKVALGLAWKAGVAAEVIGIPRGSMGERLYEAKIYLDTVDLMAWTVVIVLVSLLVEKLVLTLLERISGVRMRKEA